jgi:hypothetical protein
MDLYLNEPFYHLIYITVHTLNGTIMYKIKLKYGLNVTLYWNKLRRETHIKI